MIDESDPENDMAIKGVDLKLFCSSCLLNLSASFREFHPLFLNVWIPTVFQTKNIRMG
jgi:hypothetical protein